MSIKIKRHYPILIVLIVLILGLVFVIGDVRVITYTTRQAAATSTNADAVDYSNDVALFDDAVVHSIQVLMSEADYDSMLTTYQATGLKEYFHADVIIDGVRVDDVGIRLKGNASLSTALGRGMGGGNHPNNGRRPNNGQQLNSTPQAPGNGNMPQFPGNPGNGQNFQPPANGQLPGAGQGEAPNGFGFDQQTSSDQKKIPFMVKFNEYVDQTYQGYTNVSIRTYGTSYNEAMLAEPLTNLAARLAGIPATQTAYSGFKINDKEETLYVISELVNEDYLEKYFGNADGILYKAEIGSTLTYQGEDPSSYARSFTQQTRLNEADLAPLIAFMRFLDQTDEATFERELPKYVDVDSFATYLAVNALLVNTDSMIGMNNNYYLYYDEETERFTVLMWDTNESLGKLGGNTNMDISLTNTSSGPGARGGGMPGGGGGMGRGQNALISRFLANPTFKALYEEKLREVYEVAFTNGTLTETVERYSDLLHSINEERDLVDIDAYDQAAQKVRDFISQRMEYLNTIELFSQ